MLRTLKDTIRRSDTFIEDFAGCAALALFLVAGLHLPTFL